MMAKRRLESARMLTHYFRVAPGLSFSAFVIGPGKRATICRFVGHDRGGTVSRLLGLCDRCLEDLTSNHA